MSEVVAVVLCGPRERVFDVARSVVSALAIAEVAGVMLVSTGPRSWLRIMEAVADAHRDGRMPSLADPTDALRGGRLQMMVSTRCGRAAALNEAIGRLDDATAIARLDAGDVFYAEAKRRQLAAGGTACMSGHHDLETGRTWLPNARQFRYGLCDRPQFVPSTMVYSRQTWERVGGYDEVLETAHEWDFAVRVERETAWHFHHDVTCESKHPVLTHSKGLRADRERELVTAGAGAELAEQLDREPFVLTP